MPRHVTYLPPSPDDIRRLAFKTSHRMNLDNVPDKQDFAKFLNALMQAYAAKLTREKNNGAQS